MNRATMRHTEALDMVLFDLDGTLVDSAPDLVGALNQLRAEQGLPPQPLKTLRPFVGTGAKGMVGAGLQVFPEDAAFSALKDRFLALYAQRLQQETALFAGMTQVLAQLEAQGVRWGIVTNKSERFAQPLVAGLALNPAVLVCGDTTPFSKPHPEPLLHAARQLAVPAQRVVYVGDDLRDVQAGRAAGMRTLAAAWGYLGPGEAPEHWAADGLLTQPEDLLEWLDLA